MALLTLTSASGAPGVTTTALALAHAWPRPVVLVEADPVGGSTLLAGYLRGRIPHNRGLIDLAMAHRQNRLADTLRAVTVDLPDTTIKLIPGARSHAQALTVAGIHDALANALKDLSRTGTDVIVDAGRLGMAGYPTPLLRSADIALLVARTTLPAIAAARGWATQLHREFDAAGALPSLAMLLVGEGHPYTDKQVRSVLSLPIAASIAWDPVSAEVFHLGAARRRRFDSAPLSRTAAAAVSALNSLVDTNQARVAPAGPLQEAQ